MSSSSSFLNLNQDPLICRGECGDASSFCGLRDQMFPDKRKMGFPFDRIYSASSMKDFADAYSNMCNTPFVIRFHDEIIN